MKYYGQIADPKDIVNKEYVDNLAPKDFELIKEITLTEDVVSVVFTQSTGGTPLSAYKELFLMFVGKFTADISSGNPDDVLRIFSNRGNRYYMYHGFAKSSTQDKVFWHQTEEIGITSNEIPVYKSTYPKRFLSPIVSGQLQGTSGANEDLISDLNMRGTKTALPPFEGYTFFSTEASKFAVGSKFYLFGRLR